MILAKLYLYIKLSSKQWIVTMIKNKMLSVILLSWGIFVLLAQSVGNNIRYFFSHWY